MFRHVVCLVVGDVVHGRRDGADTGLLGDEVEVVPFRPGDHVVDDGAGGGLSGPPRWPARRCAC